MSGRTASPRTWCPQAHTRRLAARRSPPSGHTADDVGQPSGRRILIHDPYADAKSSLVHEVAEANRCQSVYSAGLGWSTLFGYEHNLDAVELLVASLVAQATNAIGAARLTTGRRRPLTHALVPSLLPPGVAYRIGQRLRAAADGAVASAAEDEGGAGLLPVLAARDERVRASMQAAFPQLVERKSPITNAEGWMAGESLRRGRLARPRLGRPADQLSSGRPRAHRPRRSTP